MLNLIKRGNNKIAYLGRQNHISRAMEEVHSSFSFDLDRKKQKALSKGSWKKNVRGKNEKLL